MDVHLTSARCNLCSVFKSLSILSQCPVKMNMHYLFLPNGIQNINFAWMPCFTFPKQISFDITKIPTLSGYAPIRGS